MSKLSGILITTLLFLNSGCRLSANFYTVDEGRFYRSAQLTKKEFQAVFAEYGIKTVINLRGEQPGQHWFEEEKKITTVYDVDLVNIHMAADRIPHRQDLLKLMEVLETSERPILVHCKAGADRTGEAVAIYQMEYMNYSKEKALESLAPKYFHFQDFTPAKSYLIRIYEGLKWVKEEYYPCEKGYNHYPSHYCNR